MTRIQIIDDDYWCSEAIIAFLRDVSDGAHFETTCRPEAADGRDIYIVDNEFDDGDHGIDLVRSIRERNPDATIIVCTGTEDRVDAKAVMNAGCNAMVPKGSAAGREAMASIVERHIRTRTRSSSSPSFLAILSDIKSIIVAWNLRMEQDAAADLSAG